ncbi:GIY-YIG nuclease family protein [Sphingomonas sp. gentR]|uniref:GIY-YIG nuclease family protein n=1 Tax=unclassified Sphingomonas TaxID=196159 RepID=UPI0012EBAAEA|nr:GIY-YIG nuclease family protein [Sphingomonas sp. LK11]
MNKPEKWGPDLEGLFPPQRKRATERVNRWSLKPSSVCKLYFISAHPDDLQDAPIKIGISYHPEARLSEMQAGSPVRLVLLGVRSGTKKAERKHHETFAADRLHGEWFKRSEPLLAMIRGK